MFRQADLGKINRILFFTVLAGAILYFGKELLIVLTFSGFLAMLMTPLANRLERIGISRVFSSLISVIIIIAVIFGAIMLLSSQIASIREDMPQIRKGLEELGSNARSWISDKFGISLEQQLSALKEQSSGAMGKAGSFITGMVMGTFTIIGSFILVMVFIFLFLLHREKYENFVVMLFREERKEEAREIISKTSRVVQQYLGGRLISILILAVLYIIGFSIVGLKNGVLLSVIAAIFTFIPYIGPFIGGLIPFLMAIISGSINDGIWVLVILVFAQLFDNYFIEPYVVGGSVNISPFFAIFVLILGGVVWGIAGVILFLPILGMLRIIFENVRGLQPYAYLIGDQKDPRAQNKIWLKLKGLFSGKNKTRGTRIA